MRAPSLIAVTRFGLGPTQGLIGEIEADPRGHVREQCFEPTASLLDAPHLRDRHELADLFVSLQRPIGEFRKKTRRGGTLSAAEEERRQQAISKRGQTQAELHFDEIAARFEHAVLTRHPFVERLVLFWSNHFAISKKKNRPLRFLVGAFEREAIRPHVLGYFEDMLIAASTHPGMLHYLDNTRSIGPGSRAGQRGGRESVNENLAREILELHTLGVGGGYTQADVGELALVLTGWVGGFSMRRNNPIFDRRWHDFGPRSIVGERFTTEGQDQLRDVLIYLAQHPSTARHVAQKFATHFVGDDPDPALVEALEDAFLVTGGDLRELAITLVEHDAAWIGEPQKTVPPYDFMVAAGRAVGEARLPSRFILRSTRDLAQEVFAPPSPAGWPDDDDAFLGGDSLLERVDFSRELARRFSRVRDVRAHARALFGPTLDPFVAEAVDRAEDREQAMILLLMSPPFQRR